MTLRVENVDILLFYSTVVELWPRRVEPGQLGGIFTN